MHLAGDHGTVRRVSRAAKLLQRFLRKPKDFSYDELARLLKAFGYVEAPRGHSGGSRVAFINRDTQDVIRMHRPHPANVMKTYQLELIEEHLREEGYLS